MIDHRKAVDDLRILDTARLIFVADNVYEINSLDSPAGVEKLEMVCWISDDQEQESIIKTGKTMVEALRLAVDEAWRRQKDANQVKLNENRA